MKVIVGMSGGIDSAVTAWMLKDQGYDVIGLSLLLFESRVPCPTSCCSVEALDDAARTCEILGIPHMRLGAREPFIEQVIEPFAAAYAKGTTPNPCILCNEHIKFSLLISEADRLGAEFIATGHYAKVDTLKGRTILRSGVDPSKDQSYFLYILKQDVLSRLLLPLGGQKKDRTRQVATELDLPVFNRPESQEICFVENNDYAAMVTALHPEASTPGPILGPDGATLGTHGGMIHYTLGQRKGLGISNPTPLYVTHMDIKNNILHVGPREDAYHSSCEVQQINWILPPAEDQFEAQVKIRSTTAAKPAIVRCINSDTAHVQFHNPAFAPAPGQAAVFYDGDIVLGGGVIISPV
jgi:tRNA-specific 2-thiouridylase